MISQYECQAPAHPFPCPQSRLGRGRGLAGQKKKHQRGGAKDNSDCQKIRPRQTQSIDRTKTTPESDSGRSSQTYPDRKSTRLNSSHVAISYAVFCLKKKKKKRKKT